MASFPVNVKWSMSKVAVPPSLPRRARSGLPAAPASLPEKVESLIVSVPLDVYSTAPAAWPQSLSENVVPVIVTSPAGPAEPCGAVRARAAVVRDHVVGEGERVARPAPEDGAAAVPLRVAVGDREVRDADGDVTDRAWVEVEDARRGRRLLDDGRCGAGAIDRDAGSGRGADLKLAQGERVGPRGHVDREGPPEPAPVQPPTSALVFAEPMASRSEHTAPLPVSSVVVVTEIVPAAAATPASMSGTTATMSAAAEASASHRARARGAVAREALGMERTPCSKSERLLPEAGVYHTAHRSSISRRTRRLVSDDCSNGCHHFVTKARGCAADVTACGWPGAREERDPPFVGTQGVETDRWGRCAHTSRSAWRARVPSCRPGRSVLLLDCASKEPRERASQAPTPGGEACAKRRDRVAVRSVTPPTAAVMTLVVFTVVGGSVCERRVVSLLTSRSSDQAWN